MIMLENGGDIDGYPPEASKLLGVVDYYEAQ
jgi:hypothetical protein